jgi:DNA adenine methylase
MTAPTRPMLRWLGGKYRMREWIVGLMPAHQIYVEPFGGAASVLLAKPRSYNEVLNDLDDDLVNLYRVLRDPAQGRALVHRLRLTPYALAEYNLALQRTDDPVERAARMVIRSHMSHGSNAAMIDRPSGFRSDGRSGSTNVAGEWAGFPAALGPIVKRLRGVTIQSKPAGDLIALYDDPKVLIYLDPPYVPSTRSPKAKRSEQYHAYRHEMTVADHEQLLDQLVAHRGMIMLSGYESDLYSKRLQGWKVMRLQARAHRNSVRTELLWLNPAAVQARDAGPLFGAAA